MDELDLRALEYRIYAILPKKRKVECDWERGYNVAIEYCVEALAKSAKIIYGAPDDAFYDKNFDGDTHSAIILDIQKIKKTSCEKCGREL